MATRKLKRNTKDLLVAKVIEENTEESGPCAFCRRTDNNELLFGKLYHIGDLYCHYFCVLLSCCLVQKGEDEEGLLGFLYTDIINEIERSKKHKCSYCGAGGATLGCSVSQCRKQFHMPCGQEKHAVSLFYGNYKSFCETHAPQQRLTEEIQAKVKPRLVEAKKRSKLHRVSSCAVNTSRNLCDMLETAGNCDNNPTDTESLCVICYEPVECYPTTRTFWPPCCARDAWFHRLCLQRMALSAGMHYLKCPLCNDKDQFYRAVVGQGYYLPDRDAAWELERDAFQYIYERQVSCDLTECKCPLGTGHDDNDKWDIKLCLVCGSAGAHAGCLASDVRRFVCEDCMESLQRQGDVQGIIDALIENEQREKKPPTPATSPLRPLMPARMSVRRTKPPHVLRQSASCSKREAVNVTNDSSLQGTDKKHNVIQSRLELNLKTPRKQSPGKICEPSILRHMENQLSESPMKFARERLTNKLHLLKVGNMDDVTSLLASRLRQVLSKPKPLSVRKKVIDGILDDIFQELNQSSPTKKSPVKQYKSPKKSLGLKKNKQNKPKSIKNNTDTKTPEKSPLKNVSSKENVIIPTSKKDLQNLVIHTPPSKNKIQDLEINTPPSKYKIQDIANITSPKLKTVNMTESTMEISSAETGVNVNLIRIEKPINKETFSDKSVSPEKQLTCVLKFSPNKGQPKEIDLESFKNHYLNEVATDKKTITNKDLKTPERKITLQNIIDSTVNASTAKDMKGKSIKKHKSKKKGKETKISLKSNLTSSPKLKLTFHQTVANTSQSNQSIKLSKKRKESKHGKNKKRAKHNNVSIRNKNLKVKIQWKEEKLKLKITKLKKKRRKELKFEDELVLKQTVLNFSPETTNYIEKPAADLTPLKRKYVRQEKHNDNLKQTKLQSFFTIKNFE